MAKIESVRDLPAWFDIEKYKGCNLFGATEWFERLAYRKTLLLGNPEYPDRKIVMLPTFKEVDNKNENGEFIDAGALMLSDPVAMSHSEAMSQWRSKIGKDIHRLRAEPLEVEPWLSEALIDTPPTVANMTIADLRDVLRVGELNARFTNTPSLQDYIEDADFNNLPESAKFKEVHLHHFALERSTRTAILVALDASNADIKRAFSAWLDEARAKQAAAIKRNKPHYDRWENYGLLPYIDLHIWEMETENSIPDRVLSSALIRNWHDKGEGHIRKTLAPLAKDLMRDLSALQALASIEAAGKA